MSSVFAYSFTAFHLLFFFFSKKVVWFRKSVQEVKHCKLLHINLFRIKRNIGHYSSFSYNIPDENELQISVKISCSFHRFHLYPWEKEINSQQHEIKLHNLIMQLHRKRLCSFVLSEMKIHDI